MMKGIIDLFSSYSGKEPTKLELIPRSVSSRKYFRIYSEADTFIGTYSPDIRESIAFISFSEHFKNVGIHVPEILAVSDDKQYYLQSDLGDTRMHEELADRKTKKLERKLIELYKLALDELIALQLKGHPNLDYSVCVPRSDFDKQSILWDLNHFKYYFLKTSGLSFDEMKLEDSFEALAAKLDKIPRDSFMFRDFQTRNIILHEGQSYLIDYQGGRRGTLHYDLASLVFESKIALLETDRDQLIDYYLASVKKYREIDSTQFMKEFYLFALIRNLQVLGTYGLRGIVEKKAVFLQSIPRGLEILNYLLQKIDQSSVPGYFREVLEALSREKNKYAELPKIFDGLTLTIYSFSYRKPLPDDISGNGGGFVYDCRFLSNPGRCDEFKKLTGLDPEVQKFLNDDPEVPAFINTVKEQLNSVISSYKAQGYTNLMISFGCTGGRHRSVFMTKTIADWCRQLDGIRVLEIHREIEAEY